MIFFYLLLTGIIIFNFFIKIKYEISWNNTIINILWVLMTYLSLENTIKIITIFSPMKYIHYFGNHYMTGVLIFSFLGINMIYFMDSLRLIYSNYFEYKSTQYSLVHWCNKKLDWLERNNGIKSFFHWLWFFTPGIFYLFHMMMNHLIKIFMVIEFL